MFLEYITHCSKWCVNKLKSVSNSALQSCAYFYPHSGHAARGKWAECMFVDRGGTVKDLERLSVSFDVPVELCNQAPHLKCSFHNVKTLICQNPYHLEKADRLTRAGFSNFFISWSPKLTFIQPRNPHLKWFCPMWTAISKTILFRYWLISVTLQQWRTEWSD